MKALAIDTSSEALSIALSLGEDLRTFHERRPRMHAQLVLATVNQLLDDSGITLSQLDGIVCGHGPGSFTGIRIGISVVHGLALGADVGVMGISSLATMAYAAGKEHPHDNVVAAFDARMGEVYIGAFHQGEAVAPEQVCAPDSFAWPEGHWLAAGAGFATYADLGARAIGVAGDAQPCASAALALATSKLAQGHQWIDPADLQPVYLRDKVTHAAS